MNWVWLPDRRIKVQNVGEVKRSPSRGEELVIHEDKIFWNFKYKEVEATLFMCNHVTHKGDFKCCTLTLVALQLSLHSQFAAPAVFQEPGL